MHRWLSHWNFLALHTGACPSLQYWKVCYWSYAKAIKTSMRGSNKFRHCYIQTRFAACRRLKKFPTFASSSEKSPQSLSPSHPYCAGIHFFEFLQRMVFSGHSSWNVSNVSINYMCLKNLVITLFSLFINLVTAIQAVIFSITLPLIWNATSVSAFELSLGRALCLFLNQWYFNCFSNIRISHWCWCITISDTKVNVIRVDLEPVLTATSLHKPWKPATRKVGDITHSPSAASMLWLLGTAKHNWRQASSDSKEIQ